LETRKKILFISHDCSNTGAVRELLLILKHIDKSIYEPVVITGKDGPLRSNLEQHAKVYVVDLSGIRVKVLREIINAFKRYSLIRNIKPDLVYCNTIMTSRWLFFAKLFDKPTITHIHELSYVFETLSPLERYLLHNYTDIAVCASTAIRKYLLTVSALNPGNLVVFHEAIEISDVVLPKNKALMHQLQINEDTIVIGMIGKISHLKGSDLFVDVAKFVKEFIPSPGKFKFIIIGGFPHEDGRFNAWLQDEIAESDIKNDLVITSVKENVDQYLSLVDIFILPSREAPFSLALLEAMAASKAIVAFNVDVVPEIINEQSGLLIKPLDLVAMKEAILKLADDSTLRIKMGTEAHMQVGQNFNIARNIKRLEKIVESAFELNKHK
jgi:glycosyltransferase involved in cell wall biosynthesis